jgi:hypothetical protein
MHNPTVHADLPSAFRTPKSIFPNTMMLLLHMLLKRRNDFALTSAFVGVFVEVNTCLPVMIGPSLRCTILINTAPVANKPFGHLIAMLELNIVTPPMFLLNRLVALLARKPRPERPVAARHGNTYR